MAKRKYILIWLIMFFSVPLNAQEITVDEFHQSSELTAQSRKTEKRDDDGNRYALIRVLTTDKGFHFDVGSIGSEPPDEDHVAEIWVYVGQGARHISISHKKYGTLERYDFPEPLQGGRTYIMKLKYDKGVVNTFDNSRHQKIKLKVIPANSTFRLNGVKIALNKNGEPEEELELPYVTNQYSVEAEGYYKKDSIVSIDDNKAFKELTVELVPITGFLRVDANPSSAEVFIDEEFMGSANKIEPFELRIGKHYVKIVADGYKEETKTVSISEKATELLSVHLSKKALYQITSNPTDAQITIDKDYVGVTPCNKELVTGLHTIKATKSGYKDYHKSIQLNSSTPTIYIPLKKIYNYKNEFYIEGNVRAGAFVAYGASIGCYIQNFNAEVSYLLGTEKSETIYWSNNTSQPASCNYSPSMNISTKIGWGIPVSTRFRITPQVGISILKLTETIEESSNNVSADGANVTNGVASLRFSAALFNHFAISITPEYLFSMNKSKGYTALSDISSKIQKWGEGFNVKLGITAFF